MLFILVVLGIKCAGYGFPTDKQLKFLVVTPLILILAFPFGRIWSRYRKDNLPPTTWHSRPLRSFGGPYNYL